MSEEGDPKGPGSFGNRIGRRKLLLGVGAAAALAAAGGGVALLKRHGGDFKMLFGEITDRVKKGESLEDIDRTSPNLIPDAIEALITVRKLRDKAQPWEPQRILSEEDDIGFFVEPNQKSMLAFRGLIENVQKNPDDPPDLQDQNHAGAHLSAKDVYVYAETTDPARILFRDHQEKLVPPDVLAQLPPDPDDLDDFIRTLRKKNPDAAEALENAKDPALDLLIAAIQAGKDIKDISEMSSLVPEIMLKETELQWNSLSNPVDSNVEPQLSVVYRNKSTNTAIVVVIGGPFEFLAAYRDVPLDTNNNPIWSGITNKNRAGILCPPQDTLNNAMGILMEQYVIETLASKPPQRGI